MKLSNLQKKLKKSEQYLPAEDTFFLADRLKDLCGKSALDIGCGSGYLTEILNSKISKSSTVMVLKNTKNLIFLSPIYHILKVKMPYNGCSWKNFSME